MASIVIQSSMRESWAWADAERLKAYIDLLLLTAESGTADVSQLALAKRWGWSRKRVRTFMAQLEVGASFRARKGPMVPEQIPPLRSIEGPEKGQNGFHTRLYTPLSTLPVTSLDGSSSKKQDARARPEPAPLYEGCEYFRATDRELGLAEKAYQKIGLSPELITHAIDEVDGWLTGTTSEAIKARSAPTHYRRLSAAWVVRNLRTKLPSENGTRRTTFAEERAQRRKAVLDQALAMIEPGSALASLVKQ